jgi:ATP-dependent helicase HrpB
MLPAIRAALRDATALVLQAPPGAGKTTRVPLALLDEPWLAGQTILLLEPRRLAARAAAARMAAQRNEPVGQTVGYRIRFDRQVSRQTRIEVLTEGILTRRLQRDPALEGVGLVIFDEFHERSLHADLALALCLDSQRAVARRPAVAGDVGHPGGRRGGATARQCAPHHQRRPRLSGEPTLSATRPFHRLDLIEYRRGAPY